MPYPTHHYGTTMSSGAPATPEVLQRLVELELLLARLIAEVRAHSPRTVHLDSQDAGAEQKGGHEK